MRILQVIPYFAPKWGGDVNVCYNLSKYLVKCGHDVTVITTDFEFSREYARAIEREGVQVIPFHCIANIALFLYSPSMKSWLEKNVQNFDIVHLHGFRSYQNNIVHYYTKKYNIPYVLHAHGSLPRRQKRRLKELFDWFWGNKILRDTSKLIAISKEEAKDARQMGLDAQKISVIYNGMDIKYFRDLPRHGEFKKRYNIKGKIILYLGRIHKLKGIDFVIKVFSKLVKEMKDPVFIIAGPDDGYKSEIENLIKALDLNDKIKLIGFLDDKDKLSAYLDANLFVHTVRYMGGVGLAPLEAILCGTPVIVTKECGEVIKEANCGYFVRYGNINDLKEKMRYLLENPMEGEKMVRRGKEYIYKNLIWDKVVKKVERVYEDCIHNV